MEVILVRHGESEANAQGIIQGQGDYRLSEKGRSQALATATALIDFHPYRIYVSPLRRAHETAEIINRPHNADLIVLDDLIEYHLGEFEGLCGEEITARFPELPEKMKQGVPFHHLAPGAETDAAASARTRRALQEILDSGLPRVIVVSHLGILEHLIRLFALDLRPDDSARALCGPLLNCSITWLDFHPVIPRVIKFNDVSHLKNRSA